jgi:hypothetical protein
MLTVGFGVIRSPVGRVRLTLKGSEVQRMSIDCTEQPDAAAPGSRSRFLHFVRDWLHFAPQPLTKEQTKKEI